MSELTFVHAADLHIDTPFRGLSNLNSELAQKLKEATYRSFRNIINLCISEKVDFLLVAGDIFDGDSKSLAAQLRFISELKRLNKHGIPAYIIAGNHDPLQSWMKELHMPDMVHRFVSGKVERVTFSRDNKPVADIYGVSFESRSELGNLASLFTRENHGTPYAVALLHGTLGSAGPHHSYAPFTIGDVIDKGFDYWALGHIHKHSVVRNAFPAIVYPGNPQGRDFGETGERGCYLVKLKDNLPPQLQFVPTQQLRFEELGIDLTGLQQINELQNLMENAMDKFQGPDIGYLFRLRLTGRTSLHGKLSSAGELEELLNTLNQVGAQGDHFRWTDRIELATRPDIDLDQYRQGNDFAAAVIHAFDELIHDTGKADELLNELDKELSLPRVKNDISPLSPEEKAEMLQKAQWMLLDQLIKHEQ